MSAAITMKPNVTLGAKSERKSSVHDVTKEDSDRLRMKKPFAQSALPFTLRAAWNR